MGKTRSTSQSTVTTGLPEHCQVVEFAVCDLYYGRCTPTSPGKLKLLYTVN